MRRGCFKVGCEEFAATALEEKGRHAERVIMTGTLERRWLKPRVNQGELPMNEWEEARLALHDVVRKWRAGRETVDILEAGGGANSRVEFERPKHVTVIDASEAQLQRNVSADEKICADLHSIELDPASFDAVVCYEVVEHVQDPELVLRNLATALRPGGIMILAAPNPSSLEGLITRATPHWFHILVYRSVFKHKMAGTPGYPPFPGVHHPGIEPRRLARFSKEKLGMDEIFYRSYASSRVHRMQRKSPLVGRAYTFALQIYKLVNDSADKSDFYLALRKNR